MGQAKKRGSREQRVEEAIKREAAHRLAHQKVLSMRESPKRAAAKAMMTLAMMHAVAGGIKS